MNFDRLFKLLVWPIQFYSVLKKTVHITKSMMTISDHVITMKYHSKLGNSYLYYPVISYGPDVHLIKQGFIEFTTKLLILPGTFIPTNCSQLIDASRKTQIG